MSTNRESRSRIDLLRLAGNGVVPQQAALAFRLLAEELSVSPGNDPAP